MAGAGPAHQRRGLERAYAPRARRTGGQALARRCRLALLPLIESGKLDWDALPELGELIAGHMAGRRSRDEITLYESHGMGIQDIYTGHYILGVAREKNIGIDFPIGGS
jgi:hypothetical protein